MSKVSAYNSFVPWPDGDTYGYNFLYRSMVKVPGSAHTEVEQLLRDIDRPGAAVEPGSEREQWLDALRAAKFIVEDDVSELSIVKHFYYKNLYASDRLNLILLPTLQCNLACPYCYEDKRPLFMTPAVEADLLRWVERHFRRKRVIQAAWFGGEPLLGGGTIRRLSAGLQAFCERVHADYIATLTTNGVLMDAAFLSAFPDLALRHVQVTFDGSRAHHDQMRRTLAGRGSFDQIMENTLAFCRAIPPEQCSLSIRINCTDANFDDIEDLLAVLPEAIQSRATLFFRWVYANKASASRGLGAFSEERQGCDSFQGLRRLNARAMEMGFHVADPLASQTFFYCEADFRDQYIIYPDGNVFLCAHDGNDRTPLFNVAEGLAPDGIQSRSLSHYARWMTTGPFAEPGCVACRLLPICLGECRRAWFEGKPNCLLGNSTLPYITENAIAQKLASLAGPGGRRSHG